MHTFVYLVLSTIPEEIESLAVVYFQATLEHNFHIMIGIQKPIVRDRSFLTFKLGGDGLKKSKSQDTQFFLLFFYSPPCTVCFQDMEILKFFMPLSVGQTTKYSKTWSSNWISQYQIPRMDLCLPSNKLRWQTYSRIMKQVSSNRPWSSLKPLNGHMKVLSQLTHTSK